MAHYYFSLLLVPILASSGLANICPDGYTEANGRCYRLIEPKPHVSVIKHYYE